MRFVSPHSTILLGSAVCSAADVRSPTQDGLKYGTSRWRNSDHGLLCSRRRRSSSLNIDIVADSRRVLVGCLSNLIHEVGARHSSSAVNLDVARSRRSTLIAPVYCTHIFLAVPLV
jgi:hypothetical protein